MSTFGGLSTAYSGLVAARAALEVTGQNVANANTAGYTRQRVDQSALAQTRLVSSSSQLDTGEGVLVTGIGRLNDAVVDARVRSSAGSAAYWSTTADAVGTVETSLGEPGTSGLSSVLNSFWSSWQTMANHTGDEATAKVLISKGALVASALSSGYSAAASAWSDQRQGTTAAVAAINSAAATVADLNGRIRDLTAAGGTTNALLDQRDTAVTTLAKLAGATTRSHDDGTVDVIVGGNQLVSGTTTRTMAVTGTTAFSAVASDPVRLTWADNGAPVAPDGGEVAARVAALGPADASGTGTGGVYAEAARTYDTVARTVADAVNTAHRSGTTSTGATGLDFFAYSATGSPATSLRVVPTGVAGVAAADGSKGRLDNSVADVIAQLGSAQTVATSATTTAVAPGAAWASYVSRVGSQSATATARSTSASAALTSATTAQTSASGVDLDEETSNLVVFQHAYQASARVINTISEVLDTLIAMGAR